ncbi:NrsF family protein [Paragemmobacter straminiformis]|uniref:DUF1109 family protein n=1 Tax=Paragemmobacter straminiformis TaxID=2045119 RepID=A0A842I7N7_9RHOB|nr:NrsF family protein [Gemmobacter straminiformis]MBC2835084.1 DUF1109 family protein [Gemmobacter straminiformis]
MRTDALIELLSRDAVWPLFRPRRIAAAVLAAVVLCSALFLALAGVRADLWHKVLEPAIAAKTLLPALVCAVALRGALRLARPGAKAGAGWLWGPAVVAALLWLRAFASLPAGQRFSEVGVLSLSECIGLILCLSVVPAVVALLTLREGASVRPWQSAFLAGLAAGSGAAAGYSFFCVQDNPLFYVTWYGLAILLAAAGTALAGVRLLRW